MQVKRKFDSLNYELVRIKSNLLNIKCLLASIKENPSEFEDLRDFNYIPSIEQIAKIDDILATNLDDILTSKQFNQAKEDIKKEKQATKDKVNARKLELLADFEAWKLGNNSNYSFRDFPVALRIKEDKLQTSHGAEVLLEDAKKLFEIAKNSNFNEVIGQKLGYYSIDNATDKQLIIGCHKIDLSEIERILA